MSLLGCHRQWEMEKRFDGKEERGDREVDYSCGHNGFSAEHIQENFQLAVDDQPNRLYQPIVNCWSDFPVTLQLKSSKSSKRSPPNWTSFVNVGRWRKISIVLSYIQSMLPILLLPTILYWPASQLLISIPTLVTLPLSRFPTTLRLNGCCCK